MNFDEHWEIHQGAYNFSVCVSCYGAQDESFGGRKQHTVL